MIGLRVAIFSLLVACPLGLAAHLILMGLPSNSAVKTSTPEVPKLVYPGSQRPNDSAPQSMDGPKLTGATGLRG
jgi:hypothetical protein